MTFLPALTPATCILVASASAQVTTQEKTTKENADGSTQQTTTTTTFTPESRTKVTEYFNTYKTNPYGLPPEWVPRMKIKELPPAWRTSQIPTGTVITQEHRTRLLEAPPELVKVLPASRPDTRYYVAGGNVVAIDQNYKVVDSLRIPSVKFDVEVDDDKIEIKKEKKDD